MSPSNYLIIKESWEYIKSIIDGYGDYEQRLPLLNSINKALQVEEVENYEITMKSIYEEFGGIYRGCIIKNGGIILSLKKN